MENPARQRLIGSNRIGGKSVGSAAAYAGMGVQFVVAILLCLYAGRWVDAKLGTGPLFLVVGVFVGAAAGFWAILRRVAADQRREDQIATLVRRLTGFVLACLTIIAGTGLLLTLAFRQPADRHALVVGGIVALAVQIGAFAAARSMARENVIAGWGLGVVVRLVSFAVFALVVVPWLGLPLTAALVSTALYLFLSTLIEPFFLKP